MLKRHRTARLAGVVLLGGSLAVALTLTGLACQATSGGAGVDAHKALSTTPQLASAYTQVPFDHEQHKVAAGNECTTCHHEQPRAAAKACYECHQRDEGHYSKQFDAFVPKLKEAMHDLDAGCRSCHDDTTEDGLWECRRCHTALNDL